MKKKEYIYILLGLLSLWVAWKSYKFIKLQARKKEIKDDLDNDFDSEKIARMLYDTMAGLGTDEDTFFAISETLTKNQKVAVWNTYLDLYDTTILDDIQGDFSGNDLQRALSLWTL